MCASGQISDPRPRKLSFARMCLRRAITPRLFCPPLRQTLGMIGRTSAQRLSTTSAKAIAWAQTGFSVLMSAQGISARTKGRLLLQSGMLVRLRRYWYS